MNMRLRQKQIQRGLAALALCAAAFLVWALATKPVLLHTHVLGRADDRSCDTYNEAGTGIAILNPFRSRLPEETANVFMRAASKAKCSPGLSEALCGFVTKR